MNIWIEYFRYDDNRNNTWAQMKEPAKWKPPDPDKIMKRFCQNKDEAIIFAGRMQDQGYHATIKTDGYV